MTDDDAQARFYQVLNHWKEARDNLAAMQARHAEELKGPVAAELSARAWIMSLAFPAPTYGTNNLDFGNGYTLKANYKQTYKLTGTDAQVEAVEKLLPPAIAEALFKRKPSFSQGAYNKLEPAHKRIVNDLIEISVTDKPSLDLIEPKD